MSKICESSEDSKVNVAGENGATVLFNEQTNYVPKRTIITVRGKQITIEKEAKDKQSVVLITVVFIRSS